MRHPDKIIGSNRIGIHLYSYNHALTCLVTRLIHVIIIRLCRTIRNHFWGIAWKTTNHSFVYVIWFPVYSGTEISSSICSERAIGSVDKNTLRDSGSNGDRNQALSERRRVATADSRQIPVCSLTATPGNFWSLKTIRLRRVGFLHQRWNRRFH